MFFLNSHVRYEDIEDGSSQTIFFGEKSPTSGELGWASGTRATLRNTGWAINGGPCRFAVGLARPSGGNPRPAAAPAAAPARPGGRGVREPAPGGANFSFGDGSVRFLKTTISPQILQRLANRADGDLLSERPVLTGAHPIRSRP